MFTQPYPIPAQTLTTGVVAVLNQDCVVDHLAFCNFGSVAVTVTVTDGQGKNLLNAMTIQPHTTQTVPLAQTGEGPLVGQGPIGQYMKGGIQWSASAGNSVDAHIMVRVKPDSANPSGE